MRRKCLRSRSLKAQSGTGKTVNLKSREIALNVKALLLKLTSVITKTLMSLSLQVSMLNIVRGIKPKTLIKFQIYKSIWIYRVLWTSISSLRILFYSITSYNQMVKSSYVYVKRLSHPLKTILKISLNWPNIRIQKLMKLHLSRARKFKMLVK